MEDSIATGLNGPADGPASSSAAPAQAGASVSEPPHSPVRTVISGSAADHARLPAAPGAGLVARTGPAVEEAIEYVPGRLAGWTIRSGIAPNSATGISFILAVCAAAWFSGGTRPDDGKAALALCGSYLAAWAAQLLIWPMATAPPTRTAISAVTTAWSAGRATSAARAGWVAGLTAVVSELAVYAGLALGAHQARSNGVWELATAAAILLSVRRTVLACSDNPGGRSRRILSGGSWRILAPPGISRLVLIAVVATVWGSRMALVALLAWSIAATVYTMTGPPAPGETRGRVTRYRDDGRFALWLGRLVRGNIAPLPPALAGLVATATLAVLGLRNLSGVLVLTPAVVMLLAAPGSGDPHDGPFDWLVPAILQGTQFLYIAAVGFSCGVPAPVTFTLCAVIALRYLTLGSPGQPDRGRADLGATLGWEGRMLVVGIGALAGLTTFAYAALAAYLGLLICSKVMTFAEGAGR